MRSRSASSSWVCCSWPSAASPATTWSTQLVKDDAVKPAGHEAWSILTQTLADRAWVWIILGVVTLVGVWFVGEVDRAARARAAAAPALEKRVTTYVIAVGALCSYSYCVAPQIARGWLSALVLVGLIVVGIEVVRNMVLREHRQPS